MFFWGSDTHDSLTFIYVLPFHKETISLSAEWTGKLKWWWWWWW
jgi:hypothetical protein